MRSLLPMACLLLAVAPLAHATTVRADKLPTPKNMTCLQVKQTISYTLTRGLLHIPVDMELGRGAYVSEREDANGVYYRAPAGAITERRTDVKESSRAGRTMTFDGGIYAPNNPTAAPTLYKYYSTDSVVVQSASGNTDCSTLAYTVDPNTHKVNVVAMGLATGVGAATGMVIGRSIHPGLHTSYGQAAGVGLAGGLIGGLIVAAIENSKVGEIVPGPALDSQTDEKIEMLMANKAAVGELGHASNPNMAATAHAPAAAPAEIAGASADVQTMAGPSPTEPAAETEATVVPAASAAVANTAMASLAQGVASQMGCGAVKADGEAAYVAPCGSYGVYIGCDTGQCRPLHTTKLEVDK
jgi:hypothetical protein